MSSLYRKCGVCGKEYGIDEGFHLSLEIKGEPYTWDACSEKCAQDHLELLNEGLRGINAKVCEMLSEIIVGILGLKNFIEEELDKEVRA